MFAPTRMGAKDDLATRIYRTVGQRIAAARRAFGKHLTQQALASRTGRGLSRSAVANIERGRQRLAVHQLYLIAQALGVEPEDLLPPAALVLGTGQEVTKDPKVLVWLSKIARRPIEKEVSSGAKTKPD